jgi:hypothetical protein
VRLFQLDGGMSLRLDVARIARAAAAVPSGWTVREVTRTELETTTAPELQCSIATLDRMAPHGWLCFAAFEDGRPLHRNFVDLRPGRPLLFAAETRPDARLRGAFRATVAHIARTLADAGEPALFSSTLRSNRASVHAHLAAGFVVYATTLDPIILGVSLRGLARRLLRRDRG